MAWPGLLSAPQSNPGIVIPCPELGIGYWLEDVDEPVGMDRVIWDGLAITVRTVDTQTGRGVASVAIDPDGLPALQVQLIHQGVWDTMLLDNFQDALCPDVDQEAPVGDPSRFFIGTAGSIFRLNRTNRDDGEVIRAILRPNVVAPAGMSARCLFQNVYLAVETNTPGAVLFTPIVDGEVLTAEAVLFAIPSDGEHRTIKRFEIPLTRSTPPTRQGIVGTWFTFLLEVLDVAGCGRLSLAGWELEHVVLSESVPGQAFTGETYKDPVATPVSKWFVGGVGAGIRRGGVGTDDDGEPIYLCLTSNEVAPAGVGGEALFQNLYLTLLRRNEVPWSFTVTPRLDGVDLEPIVVTLDAVSPLVLPGGGVWSRMLSEVLELPLAQPGRVTYHPRGAWFAYRIEADEAPDKPVEFHGVDLEYEILTESVKDVTNA